jgi:hypothetical protein
MWLLKATFFVMSPDDFFGEQIEAFLSSPCYETPKNAIKQSLKKIKIKITICTLLFFFHGPPCPRGAEEKKC